MYPFGLFDLLKTLLPSPDQTAQNPPVENSTAETDDAPMSSPTPAMQGPSLPEQEKSNACADFLYRHEQRAQGVKSTKRRLD